MMRFQHGILVFALIRRKADESPAT